MNCKYLRLLASLAFVIFLYAAPGLAQTSLGTAQNFAVLGGSTVTNTGPTTINGDLGVSPGSAVTGFPPGTVTGGTIHAADAVAAQAQNDVTTAYNALAGTACNVNLTGQDLGGLTLTPGVYCFSSSAQLTGTLTLNAQGNADAVFIFQIGSALTTASNSSVSVINGGQNCNVFWQIGSSATLGTNTHFIGNILALTSITLQTGTTLAGRALARNGAVTLDTNDVSRTLCATPCPTITLSPSTLPDGVVGTAYSQTISASPGGTYTFTVSSGMLPDGLSLNPSTGAITGTPTTAGLFNFTITATDGNGCTGRRAYSIRISCPSVPSLTLTAVISGPPVQIQITVQDTISGLRTINVLTAVNATVSIPAFTVGTTSPVVVTATKINQNQGSSVTLEAINVAGCSTVGDPEITVLQILDSKGGPESVTFAGIPPTESFVIIRNGRPGLKQLRIKVNGEEYGKLKLRDDQEISVDVSSLMMEEENTITVIGYGRRNASALIIISDLRILGSGEQRLHLQSIPHVLWEDGQKRSDINLVWGKQVDR